MVVKCISLIFINISLFLKCCKIVYIYSYRATYFEKIYYGGTGVGEMAAGKKFKVKI